MNDYFWTEKAYNESVNSAWLKFKMNLADDMVKGLDEIGDLPAEEYSDWVNPLIITAPDGKRLGCWVAQGIGNKKLIAVKQVQKVNEDENTFSPDFEWVKYTNADAAANFATEILRDKWGVLHPAFLKLSRNPEILGHESIPEDLIPKNDRTTSSASATELRDLVEKTLNELPGNPFILEEEMHFVAVTHEGLLIGISVRSSQIIEFWARIAAGTDEEVVREVVLELINEPCPHKFHPYGRSIMMALHMPCVPFEKKLFVAYLASLVRESKKYVEKARVSIERCEMRLAAVRRIDDDDIEGDEYWEGVEFPDTIMRLEADLAEAWVAANDHERQVEELKEKIETLENQLLVSESQNHEAKKREETLLKVHSQQVYMLKLKVNELQVSINKLQKVQTDNSDLKALVNSLEIELAEAKKSIAWLNSKNKANKETSRRMPGSRNEFA